MKKIVAVAVHCVVALAGRVVVYMGDDEQFEYIYRYVSNLRWHRTASAAGYRLGMS